MNLSVFRGASSHPTQILSDIFTVEEIKKKPVSKINITWIGDSNNVLNSLIAASIKFSFKLNIGCPKSYQPSKKILDYIKKVNRFWIPTMFSAYSNFYFWFGLPSFFNS